MKINAVKLVYFSPTGTTKAVLQGIVNGLNPDALEHINITRPDDRKKPLSTSENELLIIGVPVYMGRVPLLIQDWLASIQAHNTPTVCVVVYGNRAFENALLELKDIVKKFGGIPVAGAAFIGEHSFSNSEEPTAQGRPDENDLNQARAFGAKIREKLQAAPTASRMAEVVVPGEYPYGGITELWDVDFIAVNDQCTQCGVCAEVCPVGAVDAQDSAMIDHKWCITCCACIKACPQNARTMKLGPVKDAAKRLVSLYNEPKQPEYFL